MEQHAKTWRSAMAAGVLALGLMTPVSAALADADAKDLSAEWWQFVLSIPASESPLFDETGAKCVVGQRGQIWFLYGSFGSGATTRACSIPEGKSLFFPVLNVVDVNTASQTVKELRAETAPCLDAATLLSVEVDGVPLRKVEKLRVQSKVFEVTLPEGNLFGISAGTYSPAIDDGFYVMLKPLDVGPHTVRFAGASAGCPLVGGPFSVDVTYNLMVMPVSLK